MEIGHVLEITTQCIPKVLCRVGMPFLRMLFQVFVTVDHLKKVITDYITIRVLGKAEFTDEDIFKA